MISSVAATTLPWIGSQSKWAITTLPPFTSSLATSRAAAGRSNQCQHWPGADHIEASVGQAGRLRGRLYIGDLHAGFAVQPPGLLQQRPGDVDARDLAPMLREQSREAPRPVPRSTTRAPGRTTPSPRGDQAAPVGTPRGDGRSRPRCGRNRASSQSRAPAYGEIAVHDIRARTPAVDTFSLLRDRGRRPASSTGRRGLAASHPTPTR